MNGSVKASLAAWPHKEAGWEAARSSLSDGWDGCLQAAKKLVVR
jgi:hypothetical protein